MHIICFMHLHLHLNAYLKHLHLHLNAIHIHLICQMHNQMRNQMRAHGQKYKMGDAVLGRTTTEKDVGITFSADMKVSEQCGIATSKGNQILRLISRTIMFKEKQLIVPLYKAIVRPHLEYCIQARRPYRKKDIDKLERIQQRIQEQLK